MSQPGACFSIAAAAANRRRLALRVHGGVQGVGFRPFVYRLARELELGGWVANTGQGAQLEIEGPAERIERFLVRLRAEAPAAAWIESLARTWREPTGERGFIIRESAGGERTAGIQPDLAICPECLRELHDPRDRRYRYPFINCTQCGPRFSIIEGLPYDRPQTTMRGFTMCPACRAEYEDPACRRFHAQPIACPACGPQLAFWDGEGRTRGEREEALARAAEVIRGGGILALKGLGGFQLLVDARDDAAVARLRRRKRREAKPLALMAPDAAWVARACELGEIERRLLSSPAAPIVLLDRLARGGEAAPEIAESVAPGQRTLGVMLPYTPLHALLLEALGYAVVATSGNVSDEPICIDEHEARVRLRGIADAFLVHDRPIARPMDDSVARVMAGRDAVLRCARGYAPLRIGVAADLPPVLALGGQLKNAVAFGWHGAVTLGQHVGDLENAAAAEAFRRAAEDLPRLLDARTETVACDLHPDYVSTRAARAGALPRLEVQHHYAHALACIAENRLALPALAVAWDGGGYGPDRTIWGGEFLAISETGWRRVARLRPFALPGGEAAVREGRRAALGLLAEAFGSEALREGGEFGPLRGLALLREWRAPELRNLGIMLARGLNAPRCSSIGRLFDAVAALLGICGRNAYEGQAAMALETAAEAYGRGHRREDGLGEWPEAAREVGEKSGFEIRDEPAAPLADEPTALQCAAAWQLDWEPLVRGIVGMLHDALGDAERDRDWLAGAIAARFHDALAEGVVAVARRAGLERVALTGGCFQNRLLLEATVQRLREAGFAPAWHRRVPPGDGSLALGQAIAVARGGGLK